jgi:hypothetical protein
MLPEAWRTLFECTLAVFFHVLFLGGFRAIALAQKKVIVAVAAIPRVIAEPWIDMLLHKAFAFNSARMVVSTLRTQDPGTGLGLV